MNRTLASLACLAFLGAPFAAVVSSAACSGSSASLSSGTPDDGGAGSDSSAPTGDGSSAPPVSDDAGASQACIDWATARCARFDGCSDALYVQLHWGSTAACIAAGTQTCTIALSANGTGQTASSFESCAEALPTESCADFFGDNPVTACAAVAGTLAAGAPCVASSQCASTYCAVPQYATCGVCAPVPSAGDPCAITAECGARNGLACANGVCVAYAALSAACSADIPCGIGLDCVGATKTSQGTCMTAVGAVGSVCDPDRATAPSCDPTLYLTCDSATKLCVQDTVAASGAVCGAVDGGAAKCTTSGTCVFPADDAGAADAGDDGGTDAAAAPKIGTCLAASATSSPCDTAAGPACVAPAKCVTTSDASTAGTCQVANPATCQ